MTKNTLADLNNILFERMNKLNDDKMSKEQYEEEVKRSKIINETAKIVVLNSRLRLDASKFAYNSLPGNEKKNLPQEFQLAETNPKN